MASYTTFCDRHFPFRGYVLVFAVTKLIFLVGLFICVQYCLIVVADYLLDIREAAVTQLNGVFVDNLM